MQFDEIQKRSREIFLIEAADLMRELEAALLELESAPSDTGLINRVFRVMHTLKGSGATSGFQELSNFLHKVEDVYNAARESRLQIDSNIIDLTLKLADTVNRYLASNAAEAPAVLEGDRDILNALLAYLPQSSAKAAGKDATIKPKLAESFSIYFRPQQDLFRSGNDPGMFLDDLRTLGPCAINCQTESMVSFDAMDPETCYLSWSIEITTAAGEDAIRAVFMFIEGECELRITRNEAPVCNEGDAAPSSRVWDIGFQTTARTLSSPGVLEALWRDLGHMGELKIVTQPETVNGSGPVGRWRAQLTTAANQETIASAFVFLIDAEPQLSSSGSPAKVGAQTEPATAADTTPKKGSNKPDSTGSKSPNGETLRVSAERVDRLVNLVGELVILRSQVSNACALAAHLPPELASAAEALQSLSTEMRDVVLNIRMMPIEQTFSKFRRLVRDLARDLGKDVELVVEGGETEMDKTVLDALADPLMHLVRNSLDHGLEPAEEREDSGKPARGILKLKAEQRGDRVLVCVSDDGRGLNSEKIRTKAIRQGLLAEDARPTESELFQMVFLPGFSTADKVSQVSGRGVGLDVVKRQTEQLRGKVEVRSTLGRGAEFRLSLPLTLAIIEGLMVDVDGERYILPLGIARETIELSRAQRRADNGRNVVELRGELVPYIHLRELFGFSSQPPEVERVVVVEIEDQRIGLVVDKVIGNHQTVLKSLGRMLRSVEIFSGATVLGDGHIALILDVPQLLALQRTKKGNSSGLAV